MTEIDWSALERLAADSTTPSEELRRLWGDLHVGPCLACGGLDDVERVYRALQKNAATPGDLLPLLPRFLTSVDPLESHAQVEAYEQATSEEARAGLMRQMGWSPASSQALFLRAFDDLPTLYRNTGAVLSAIHCHDLMAALFLMVSLAPDAALLASGEPDSQAVYLLEMAQVRFADPYQRERLEHGLAGRPRWLDRTLWLTFRHLPEDARRRAFDAPRGWLLNLYRELSEHRHRVLWAMQADEDGEEPGHLCRLVAPLCLESLVGLSPTEPARLVWKDQWQTDTQEAEFARLERELAELPVDDRTAVVLPHVDMMGAYFPESHEAVIYLPVVRSVARQLLLRRGEARRNDDHPDLPELIDLLCLVVEIHELAHGLCYRGRTADGQRFENPDKASVIVHELWAQEMVRRLAINYGFPALIDLLDEESEGQATQYRAYRLLDGLDDDQVRAALLLSRQGRLPTPLGLSVKVLRAQVETWLGQMSEEPASTHLTMALETLAAAEDTAPLEKLEAYEAFVASVASSPAAPSLVGFLPASSSVPLRKLSQLVAWYPG